MSLEKYNPEDNNPFEDYINSLDESSFTAPETIDIAPEQREEMARDTFQRLLSEAPTLNPLTGLPWEGIFDENCIWIIGPWPEIDARKLLQSCEDGSISFVHFKRLVEMMLQDRNDVAISEEYIEEWYNSRTSNRSPKLLIVEYLENYELFTFPFDLSLEDLLPASFTDIDEAVEQITIAVKLLSTFDFDRDEQVLSGRKAFVAQVAGKSLKTTQVAKLVFETFEFIKAGTGGYTRATAMVKASGLIILLPISFEGRVHKHLEELDAGIEQ